MRVNSLLPRKAPSMRVNRVRTRIMQLLLSNTDATASWRFPLNHYYFNSESCC
jgi:hypothetical protein